MNSNGRYYVTAYGDNSVKELMYKHLLVTVKSSEQLQFPGYLWQSRDQQQITVCKFLNNLEMLIIIQHLNTFKQITYLLIIITGC